MLTTADIAPPNGGSMSKPRIEVYRDAAGQWRYRVLAANGETIAASEGYTRRADAQRGARDLLLATAEEIGAWDETTPQAKEPMFDNGGIVPSGVNTVHNGTGRPEYLTTNPPRRTLTPEGRNLQ